MSRWRPILVLQRLALAALASCRPPVGAKALPIERRLDDVERESEPSLAQSVAHPAVGAGAAGWSAPCPDGRPMRLPAEWFTAEEAAARREQERRSCIHCSRERFPEWWLDIEFEFDRGSSSLDAGTFVVDGIRKVADLLKARPDLALLLRGGRARGEPRDFVRRRVEVVRRGLADAGVPLAQIELLEPRFARDTSSVDVTLQYRTPGIVQPGSVCGTSVLGGPGERALVHDMTARGWWLQAQGEFWFVNGGRDVESVLTAPHEPLHGSGLAAIVPHAAGYATLRRGPTDFGLVFVDASSRSMTAGSEVSCHRGAVRDLALVAKPGGFFAAWIRPPGEVYTLAFDSAGTPLRGCTREVVSNDEVRALAMDWRDGTGAMAYVLASPSGLFGYVDIAWLDSAARIRGAPQTLAADSEVMHSVALAVVDANRVTVLLSSCADHVARIDLDARGEILAFDRQFMRSPGRHGVAVVRDATRVWGVSIRDNEADVRPLCDPVPPLRSSTSADRTSE